MAPGQAVLRHREPHVGELVEQVLDGGDGDVPGRFLGRAGVRSRTPRQVGPVAARLPGRLERRTGVGRGETDQHQVTGLELLTGELRVGGRVVRRVVRHGRVLPQRVVEGLVDQAALAGVPVVGEEPVQRVADQVAQRFGARPQQQRQLVDHLLVGQARLMLHQPRGDVLAGTAPLEGHQLAHRLEQHRGGLVGVDAVEHPGDAEQHPVADVGRAAEEFVEHEQRQLLGVVAQQVRRTPGTELGDEVAGDLLGAVAQPPGVHPGHAVGDRLAEPQVVGAVGEHAVGPVGQQRGDRTVRSDLALVEGPPAARVLAEGAGVLQQLKGRGVVRDQGRLHPRRQLDRGGGAVVPQEPVVRLRVRGELRSVQRHPAPRAVGRAPGRGHRGGVVSVHVCFQS